MPREFAEPFESREGGWLNPTQIDISSKQDDIDDATLDDIGTPVADDQVLIRDISDSNEMKYVHWSDIGGGGGAGGGIEGDKEKSITIENPTSSEDATFFYTESGFTISSMRAVLNGSSPSVTWTIRYASDRSAAGTEVVTSGTTTTNTTTGQSITSLDNESVPAGSWVWLETTATSGTVDMISITLIASSPPKVKCITIDSPTASEDLSLAFFDVAVTITKLVAVLVGSSPSLTWTLRHDSDRSATGSEVVTSGTVTTNTTTGDIITSFNDATIPADSFLWLETSAMSNVSQMALTIVYTED